MTKIKFYLIFLIFLVSCKDQENISVQDAIEYLEKEDVLFFDVFIVKIKSTKFTKLTFKFY